MKLSDLRQAREEELLERHDLLKKEIFQARGQQLETKAQKTHEIRQKKREIARILTILRENELRRA
jgi:large subunit ribosomal protein L29